MRRMQHVLKRGFDQLTGSHRWAWSGGLTLAVVVKIMGVQLGGWSTLIGIILLSCWLPWLMGHLLEQPWRWRQFIVRWLGQLGLALSWLPFGWGGYLASLQASVALPASWQNWLFMTRYHWLPVVGVGWFVWWLFSWKWLPSWRQQFRQPTTIRAWWLAGWRTSWWLGLRTVGRSLSLVLGWLGLALLGLGVVGLSESLNRTFGLVMALSVFVGLQLVLWTLIAGVLSPTTKRLSRRLFVVLSDIGLMLILAGWWLSGANFVAPAVIAHRGVNGHNGVQNTTSVLKRTNRATHPTAVEMDIQPTADDQWIVIHDPTLMNLAKRPGTVTKFKKSQLAGLPLTENGRHGQLSTFSGYLKTAHRLKQALIVEIKPLGQAAQLMPTFATRYANRLQRDHHQVHSLDYVVVARLKQQVPELKVGYITPFYLTNFKANAADFYSLQALTVTREQLAAAHRQHRHVYLWTVDRSLAMQRLSVLGADGLITNQPGRMRRVLRAPRLIYTPQLLNWVISLLSIG
ncbi:glycerophosphodiester phosphodiesterase [Lactiplantibacillus mudanjiangensis]|uniref:Glycerophosphodiester phosphodiesterase [Lactobacillus sp.] n=1 Tax=Lactiplantibacillus mudanjiangensis TaxID=1296538 RepID=A0A660E3D2_9LACO|nr:glycerophosphodiester phosphodiesterase [Lactiplantibacillus mudanjiangensis]VDG25670.1 glycerophosphodiester phosphodiesterase [Lactobacillus sp.] [Lactiplantibacillus mudanjiangensis]VDG29933.1 glycerophosphodiester phosphodiesterase [Lactobacillus sp.] [Lactiplantibacillus mudanjiangensis]VDG33235.1 glycerophosphodiester phosphodiesterase [Lactobacillus sp.] [Lactiplantibacillus mudanjiangensis]